jgi:hypothetical protein
MGRCTVTRGQRKIGRTIRKIENSIEFSNKECKAKIAEQEYKKKNQEAQGYTDDSPIQNLLDNSRKKQNNT